MNTGWFASFETLSSAPGARVPYADDAFRFWGSTFDPSGIYRFDAAMRTLEEVPVTIAEVHRHALGLQKHFLDGLARLALRELPATALVPPAAMPRGNFFTFDVDGAEDVHRRITAQNVTIDRRDRRLRFGFGIYQDEAQVTQLLERIASVLQ